MEGWGAGPGQIGATGQVLLHRGALLAVEWDHQRRQQTGDTGLWWGAWHTGRGRGSYSIQLVRQMSNFTYVRMHQ